MALSDTFIPPSLEFSGDIWHRRIGTAQEGLIRSLAGLTSEQTRFGRLMGSTLGDDIPGAYDCWNFAATYQPRFASQWLNATELQVQGDADLPILLENGNSGLLLADMVIVPDTEGIKINGFLLEDLAYEGPASALGINAGQYILLPRPYWPETPESEFLTATVEGIEYLIIANNSAALSRPLSMYETIRHDTWFIPCYGHPEVLLTSTGPLVRNQGFIQVGNWLAVFDDPFTLWPSGIAVSILQQGDQKNPRSCAMRADMFNGYGKDVMTYLRFTQSARAFEQALSELAGEEVLTEEFVVERAQPVDSGWLYWDRSGRNFYLMGTRRYADQEKVPSGRGHRAKVWTYWADGEFWNFPEWLNVVISSKLIWPLLPETLIQNTPSPAYSWGAPVRSRFFSVDGVDDAFWDAVDADGTLTALLGFTTAGESAQVSPVAVLFNYMRERLLLLESNLKDESPGIWYLVRSWAERERPSGSVLLTADRNIFQSEANYYVWV